ncbi:amino acid adenylation domain-containing protein [Archangium sp.]|uniref:non-ribosomal peptide synthetase n=1 Tax=Archangium sp. TaxID=1872627 RepID=UPI00286BAE91|nr:amino acid adenylation domain-containing protein [Archangium sp.]
MLNDAPSRPSLQAVPRTGRLPLSLAQERWWFLEQLFPGSTLDTVRLGLRVRGPLDVASLEQALSALVARHEPLRTRFGSDASGPFQEALPAPRPSPLAVEDVSALPQAERETEARRRLSQLASRPFQLTQGEASRFGLVRLSADEHLFLWSAHPIAADATSLARALPELWAAYERIRGGVAAGVSSAPLHYADHAHQQREQLKAGALEPHYAFWRRALDNPPAALELPRDRSPQQGKRGFHAAQVRFSLSSAEVQALREAAQAQGASLEAALLAGYALLLGRYARQEELIVGVGAPGRSGEPLASLFGPFQHLLPLRVDLMDQPSTAALLQRTQRSLDEALAHQEIPPEAALTGRQVNTNVNLGSLMQAAFHLEAPSALPQPATLRLSHEEPGTPESWLDLSLALRPTGDGLEGTLTYSTDLFDAARIERLAAHYRVLLGGLAKGGPSPAAAIPLLTPAELHQQLVTWNDTARPFPQTLCVHEPFEAQAARTPDAVAVHFEGQTLTYRQLDTRANQLARHLVKLGIGPESRVAVAMQPSLEIIVALYGILKAGGAYVPVDPDAPSERLTQLFTQAEVRVVLTQGSYVERLPLQGRTAVALDTGWTTIAAEESSPLVPRRASPANLAYVIFTSGSTGEPKGVLVSHSAVVNHNLAVAERFGLGPEDRVLQFTPVFFDAAGEEIYPPLLSGSSIVVRGELVPIGEFRELIARERLSVLSLPPAYLHEWLSELARQGGTLPECLRLVLLGGDKLLPETWALWQRVGGRRVPWINVYGPTEATVTSAMARIERGEGTLEAPVLPIGGPVANARIYLLDAHLRPVPAGHPGELFIGGAGLARGYLGQPGQTAQRFVPDPFSTVPGARLYRTGDLARYLPDGRLEFLGRVDHQVKIRGNRVEPGEVEAALRKHPAVQDAVVLAREDSPGDKRLVAYVVAQPGSASGVELMRELRKALGEKLPQYMVPSAFVPLPSMPLSANGKVDRKALPKPEEATSSEAATSHVAPRDSVEETLAGIWSETLNVKRVGAHDDFFELGGHSLAAMQILILVEERLGVQLDLPVLFEQTTVAKLAKVVSELKATPVLGSQPVDVDQLSDEQVEAMLRQLSKS